MDWTTLAAVAAILFAASFVQGLTGFGFGLVAMALMPLALDFRHATLLVAILGLFPNLQMLVRCRGQWSWEHSWTLLLSTGLACPVGVYFVHTLDEHLLIRLLGALIVAFSLRELMWHRAAEHPLPKWTAWPLGALAGLFGSAFNIGGPPLIAYVYSQHWESAVKLAVLQIVFLEIGVLRVILTASTGAIDAPLIWLALPMLVPMAIAVTLGQRLLQRLTTGRLRRPVFWFLLAMGVKYIVTG